MKLISFRSYFWRRLAAPLILLLGLAAPSDRVAWGNLCLPPAAELVAKYDETQPPRLSDIYGESAAESLQKFEALSSSLAEDAKAEAIEEIWKMLRDPWHVPSAHDFAVIRSGPGGAVLHPLAVVTLGVQKVLRPIAWISKIFAPNWTYGLTGVNRERGWAYRLGQRIASPFKLAISFAFPFADRLVGTATEPIFRRLAASSGRYELTAEERQTLINYNKLELFEAERVRLQRLPMLARVRNFVKVSLKSLIFVGAALNANHLYQLHGSPGSLRTTRDFVVNERPAPDEVMVVTETTPFPHTALWIGDRVYSFGVERLSVSPSAAYLLKDQMQPGGGGEGNSSVNSAGWIMGQPSLKRSIQVARLRLGREKVEALQKDLEAKSTQTYVNVTGVNDCSTMAMRAIGMENRLFDAGPGQVMLWLSFLKTTGDPRVLGVYQLTSGNPSSHTLFSLRNAAVNQLEISTLSRLLVANQVSRGRIDFAYKADHLVEAPNSFDRDSMRIIDEGLRKQIKAMVAEEARVRLFALKQDRLNKADQNDPAVQREKEKLKQQLASYLKQERQRLQDEANNGTTPVEDKLVATYRLELLDQAERDGFNIFLSP